RDVQVGRELRVEPVQEAAAPAARRRDGAGCVGRIARRRVRDAHALLVMVAGRAAAAARPVESPASAGYVDDVLQELLPGRAGRLLVLLDALDRVRRRGLDVALVRTEDLRLELQRRRGADLADGRVAEE